MECKGSLSLMTRGRASSRAGCQSQLQREVKTGTKGTDLRSEAAGREPGKRSRPKSREVESKTSLGLRPSARSGTWCLLCRYGVERPGPG